MNVQPLLLVLLAACAGAAELVVSDVRLGLVTRPADFDFEVASPTTAASGSDAFDGGLSLEGGLRWSFAGTGQSFGLIVGGDAGADAQAYDGGDGLATLWARAAIGGGWAATDRITVVAEAMAGFGLSTLSLPASQIAPDYSADGTALLYEARLTGTWQFTRGFNAGLAAGWLIASHDLSGDEVEVTLDQSGWYAGLVFGWRLDDTPRPLE
jgi:hypothetical protein